MVGEFPIGNKNRTENSDIDKYLPPRNRDRTWLIRCFIFLKKRWFCLKEIGTELEQAREAMGVSLEEAATDLKLKPSQLDNVEKGNRTAFKDVFELKQIIRDYAKYLSLEYEKLEDEFNEFVFEYTSKIPLEEIAKANEERKLEKRDIISPYTVEYKRKFSFLNFLTIILLIAVVGFVAYMVFDNLKKDGQVEATNLSYFIKGEWFHNESS